MALFAYQTSQWECKGGRGQGREGGREGGRGRERGEGRGEGGEGDVGRKVVMRVNVSVSCVDEWKTYIFLYELRETPKNVLNTACGVFI